MKYLVQTGVTPQLIYSKVADITDGDEERQLETWREASDSSARSSLEHFLLFDPMIILGSTHHGEMIIFTSTPWSWCAQWQRGHVHSRFSLRSTRLDLHFNNFNEYGKANWKQSHRVRRRWKRASNRLILLNERTHENMYEQSPTPRTRRRELRQARRTPRRRRRSGVKSEKYMV